MAECDAAGASVAKVAMAHGINANVVHRWRQLAREGHEGHEGQASEPMRVREFIPVSLTAAPEPVAAGDIRIELRRGSTAMTITWPMSAATQCAAWMRELLR
jgi:transposase